MKKLLLLISGLFVSFFAQAQVAVSPAFPTADEPITITYDAKQGASGLEGASSVHMHSGVIISGPGGTGWQYTVGEWGNPNVAGEMTSLGNDLWEITITPRDYYAASGLTASETVYRLGMVFRESGPCGGYNGASQNCAEGKDSNGQDIFVDMYTSGTLELLLQSPTENPLFVDLNDNIFVEAASSSTSTITLYINGVSETSVADATTLEYTLTVTGEGKNEVLLVADNGAEQDSVFFSYLTRTAVVNEPLPAGVQAGVNYDPNDATTATLVLQAPNKTSAYVLGDFNEWSPAPEYFMKKDGEFFWVELTGLTPGRQYVYQYLVDESIRIGDPYTDQVSDPWDDSFIPETIYPNLVDYPTGKTNFRASVLTTGQTPYAWEIEDFAVPPVEQQVIYELLIRDFDESHSYLSVIDRLDYLDSLGVNVIELMPVNEFEGNISWGYNPNFFFAPDKYYGTKNALKQLIDECHKRGMAVYLDMVLNHSFNSAPMARLYWNQEGNRPAADNPWYNEFHNFENTLFHWGSDFDHESTYTEVFTDRVLAYWIEEYKFDGYRLDFTKGFSNNYKSVSGDEFGSNYDAQRVANLKRLADQVWQVKSDAVLILEHLANNDEETELANYGFLLWGNMHGAYKEGILGYVDNSNLEWGYAKARGWNDLHLVSYMESHDEERQMYEALNFGQAAGPYNVKNKETALDRMALAASFFFTVPGPKMIWQFGEYGYDISINEGGRTGPKPIKWEYLEEEGRRDLYDVYRGLIHLKTSQATAFSEGTFSWGPGGAIKWINLVHDDLEMSVVGNFGISQSVANPRFISAGTWYDYFSGDSLEVTNPQASVTLAPGEFHIFTNKKLDLPVAGNPVPFGITPLAPTNLVAVPAATSGISLTWQDNTNLELNYVVERSDDEGQTFTRLATLPANAKSYTDNEPQRGVFYYRVKATGAFRDSDYSEAATTEQPLAVETIALNDGELKVYPNPFGDKLHFRWEGQSSGKPLEVELYDLFGRKVLDETFMLTEEKVWQLGQLPQGLYLLRAQDGQRQFTGKILRR